MSRKVLARAALAEVIGARCAGRAEWWSRRERDHRAATTAAAAAAVIDDAVARACGQCPAMDACGTWAVSQQYTGLAAGAAYLEGRRMPRAWVMPKPGRAPTKAG